jgi:NDP-sugar pyrophosphorylase family protein
MADVVILAGGRGTRLAPYTTVFPKPLMPIGDRPVLEILLRRLAAADLRTIHLAVGHLAELIEAYFGDGSRFGVELWYARELEPLGTAGPLATIEFEADTVLVMNGDLVTTLDFRELLDAHAASGAAATIAVHQRDVPIEYGVVKRDGAMVAGFEEKPTLSYEISMGVYAFERAAIDLVPQGTRFDFPDLVYLILERGLPIHAHVSSAFWLDIGQPEDYELANSRFDELRGDLLGDA